MSDMDGWIKHDRGNCPVPPDSWVQIVGGSGDQSPSVQRADYWYWGCVTAYRVFAPVADLPPPAVIPYQPAPSDFVRQTAARIMAADYWRIDRADADMAKAAVAAAIALEKALQEAGQ